MQTLFTAGAAGYGAAEYGEFATAVASAHREGDSYEGFYRAFRDLGLLAGCQFHCAPMAPQRRNQVLFDWLDGVL